jgi:tRNA uridine 5-carboxymethylaminomethyl modification enzyme
MRPSYDVIVIGCGHAGSEAAAASANLGCKTLLVGLNLDSIAWMPCNPAIGGPAKSHLVKEIDALGGIMGLAADATYLQLKTLNLSRGPAVHSLRAQSDKHEYSEWVRNYLQSLPNLSFYQAMITEIMVIKDEVIGVKTALGEEIKAKSVIITSGTFLQGKVFTGKQSHSAGRASEPAAIGLTASLKQYGFELGRLKTGTPTRIDKRTINFDILEEYPADNKLSFFSFLPNRPVRKQISCYATRSTSLTHQIIKDNLFESPMYSGLIEGIGPRYCPSIEDKVVRFADKESHLFFLEPEGKNTNEIYLQGCSTSLPINIQWQIVNSLPGLERAEIIRPAYAVEYDFLRPIQFKHSLESKLIKGLFAAGQLLGTSGYEEAASQGFMAGINAAKCVQGKEALILKRSESYIGTLLDDLVIKEITEPYRMMTSRSEHRLHLRQDNADRRLTPIGREIGLVDDYRWKCFEEKLNKFDSGMEFLKSKRIKANEKTNHLLEEAGQSILKKDQALTLAEIWSRPSSNFDLIKKLEPNLPEDLLEFEIETEIKYAGYVTRQDSQVEKLNTLDNKQIPDSFDYQKLNHISSEAREKLTRIKPQTIGQASKIDGVRSADINVLLISLASSGKH